MSYEQEAMCPYTAAEVMEAIIDGDSVTETLRSLKECPRRREWHMSVASA